MTTTAASSPPAPWSVLQNNWLKSTRKYIAEKEFDTNVAFTVWPKPDPAPGCSKSFTSSYKCSPGTDIKTVNINAEAAGNIAVFNCSSEYAKCTAGILTLTDDGNLVLSNGTTTIWQSNTNKVGIPLKKYEALNSKYKRNYLKTGEFLYPDEFVGSPSGNCILICEKKGNVCSLSIVYHLSGCNMPGEEPSTSPGSRGYITDIDGYRATYSLGETNQDTSLNGKVVYINGDMEIMEYPEKMLGLSNEYIDAGSYDQQGVTIKTISNSDLDNCKTECSAISNCYGFIHYEKDKKCDFKNKSDLFPNNIKRILSNDARMFVRKYKIDNPNSCNGEILSQYVTSDFLVKLPRWNDMTPDTLCTLGEATSKQLDIVKNRESELSNAMTEFNKSLTNLTAENNELDIEVNSAQQSLEDRSKSYNNFLQNKTKGDIANITAMSIDSKLENVRQNLNYMMWTGAAAIAILTIIKTSR